MTERFYLTRPQIIAAGKLLDLHCKKNSNGLAVYDEGWDDKTIHAAIGTKSSLSAVASLRTELVGPIYFKGENAKLKNGNLNDETERWIERGKKVYPMVASLKLNVGGHDQEIGELIERYNEMAWKINTLLSVLVRLYKNSSEEGELNALKIKGEMKRTQT